MDFIITIGCLVFASAYCVKKLPRGACFNYQTVSVFSQGTILYIDLMMIMMGATSSTYEYYLTLQNLEGELCRFAEAFSRKEEQSLPNFTYEKFKILHFSENISDIL